MLTTAQVAEALGVSPGRVLQLARLRNVPPAMKAGGAYLWHKRSVEKLRPKPVGRPLRCPSCNSDAVAKPTERLRECASCGYTWHARRWRRKGQ